MKHTHDDERITQSILEEFRQLQAEMTQTGKRYRQLHDWLLSARARGLDLEPGNLGIKVIETPMRRLSFEKVVMVIGPEDAEQLRAQVPVTVSRRIVITSTQKAPKAVPDLADDESIVFRAGNYG
jgi:hypothetical protein